MPNKLDRRGQKKLDSKTLQNLLGNEVHPLDGVIEAYGPESEGNRGVVDNELQSRSTNQGINNGMLTPI